MTPDSRTTDAAPAAGHTIADWTRGVGIARATFYTIADDCLPHSVMIGRRRIIIESPAVWLERMRQRGGATLRQPEAA